MLRANTKQTGAGREEGMRPNSTQHICCTYGRSSREATVEIGRSEPTTLVRRAGPRRSSRRTSGIRRPSPLARKRSSRIDQGRHDRQWPSNAFVSRARNRVRPPLHGTRDRRKTCHPMSRSPTEHVDTAKRLGGSSGTSSVYPLNTLGPVSQWITATLVRPGTKGTCGNTLS
jgi:hypothetical protein